MFGAGAQGLGGLMQAASSLAPGFGNMLSSFANAGAGVGGNGGSSSFQSSASSGSNGTLYLN